MNARADARTKTSDAFPIAKRAYDECVLPIRRNDVRIQELDGEVIIFDPVSADTHHLNQTAYWIWKQCDGIHTPDQIATRLAEEYDVSQTLAKQHVERTVEELSERNLIVASGDA